MEQNEHYIVAKDVHKKTEELLTTVSEKIKSLPLVGIITTQYIYQNKQTFHSYK